MGVLEVSIMHHVGIVLAFICGISWFGHCHPVVYLVCLVYLYLVNERYATRLRRRIQFEERKHANQKRLLSDAETVRWLNHAIQKVWPICMEQIASQQFLLPIVPWFLEKYKPWTAKKAVMKQLYLGRNSPVFTEIRALNQSGDDDHVVLELGMNFLSADDMSAILAIQLRKRLGFGMWANMHITGIHIEGKVLVGVKFLRKWPFLGRLRLCFVEPPFFQMTVKPIFNHGIDVTEFPGIAGWLDKLLAIAFEQTLVEPNMLVVDVEKFASSPDEGWFSMDGKSAIAYAKLELIEAADMKPSDLNGLADPYVKAHLGPYRFQTKIQRKTLTPTWLEEFTIPITSWESPNELVLEVLDKDHIFDDTLGDYSVSINELRGGQRHDMWLSLRNIKMGRLHIAITVLEGDACDAIGSTDKQVNGCDNEQRSNDEQLKLAEVTPGEAAETKPSLSVPGSHVNIGDEFEPIDIEGQERTRIWVHHPGPDVSQKWEPRKRRNRHSDTELQREDADCTSVVSESQQDDGGSNDDHPNGHKARPLGSIKKGVMKIGSLFLKSPKDGSPKHLMECPLPTPRPNLKATSFRNAGTNQVMLDGNVPEDIRKDDAVSDKQTPQQEDAGTPGKGSKREMAKGILKQVSKSAASQLKSVLSKKGSSKSREGEGAPKDADSSTSSLSTGEECLPCSGDHNFIINETPIESTSVPATGQNSSTGGVESRSFGVEGDGDRVDSSIGAEDQKRSPARKVVETPDSSASELIAPSDRSPRVST